MSTFDSLDKTFNVDATIDAGAKAMKSITKRVKKEYNSDAEEDYDYVRGMLKSSAESLCRITAEAEDMASETQHPSFAQSSDRKPRSIQRIHGEITNVERHLVGVEREFHVALGASEFPGSIETAWSQTLGSFRQPSPRLWIVRLSDEAHRKSSAVGE